MSKEEQLTMWPMDSSIGSPGTSQGVVRELDVSRVGTYLDCRRRFRFQYRDHLASKAVRNVSAEYGTAVHAFMDVWHGVREWDTAWGEFERAWDKLGGDAETDGQRTKAHAEWFLKRYTTKYPEERFIVLNTERPFEIDIGPYIFQGRIDKIVKAPGEAPQILDHKTTSQLGYSTMLKYHPNLQMLGYVWAGRELISRDIYSCIVDLISTAKNATKPIDECFARRVVNFSDAELNDFPKMFLALANEINDTANRDKEGMGIDAWIPNYSQCTSYGECPFRRLCTQPREIWDGIIAADFQEKIWSPIKDKENVLRGRFNVA